MVVVNYLLLLQSCFFLEVGGLELLSIMDFTEYIQLERQPRADFFRTTFLKIPKENYSVVSVFLLYSNFPWSLI